jgi:hypothetical protein
MSRARLIFPAVAMLAALDAHAEGFTWDVPETYDFVEVPSVQAVNGIPIRFNVYYSRWPLEQLAFHLLDEFQKAGLFVPPMDQQVRFNGQVFSLTAFDPIHRVAYTAILKPCADKTTEVIAGQGYLKDVHPQVPNGDFAPLPPTAAHAVKTTTEGMTVLTYETSLQAEEISSFYKETLGTQGYSPAGLNVYRKGRDELSIRISEESGSRPRAVVLTLRNAPGERQ